MSSTSAPTSPEATQATPLVSLNPATGQPLGEAPKAGPAEVAAAVARARAAQPAWEALGYGGRRRALLAWRDAFVRERERSARLLSEENGKPYAEALAELATSCDFLAHFAKEAESILAEVSVGATNPMIAVRDARVNYRALGVVGIISPWNFPVLLAMAEAAMALAAGNTVVLKPSELTPLIGLELGRLAREANLPAGVFEVVTGDGVAGAALSAAEVDRVCFTGSVPTGQKVATAAAQRLIPSTLELGGKDPAIVRHDAKVAHAAQGVTWAAFTNAGQVCASAERLLVDARIAPSFLPELERQVRALTQGPSAAGGNDLGPMISPVFRDKVHAQVQEAIAKGAKLMCGGVMPDGPGFFYPPTLLLDVPVDAEVWQEETFGPVLPIRVVEGGDEAMLAEANANRFGLSATVWTSDLAEGQALAKRVEAGTVWVNTGLASYGNPMVPRGGWKHSGLGKIGGPWGLMEMVKAQAVEVSGTSFGKPWWYPSRKAMPEVMDAALRLFHSEGIPTRLRALADLVSAFTKG